MLRALLWKEWRALRALRWFGWMLVPVLGLGAVAREIGWLGRQVSSQDLIADILPIVFALAIWPLLGVMCSAQCFAGERIVGTERFLLERPVTRRSIWLARLAACLLTVTAVAVTHALLWLLLAQVYLPDPRYWLAVREAVLSLGLLVPLTILGGAIAGLLATSTLAAALGGLVLGSLPLGLAWWGVTRAPWATVVDSVAYGWFPPWLLVFALPVASHAAFCRGEASGRGKYWRGIGWIAGPVMLVLILLFVGTPIVVTRNAREALGNIELSQAPSGNNFLVAPGVFYGGLQGMSRSWWFDGVGKRMHRFDFAAHQADWSADGHRLQVLINDGLFEVVQEYNADGEMLREWKNLSGSEYWRATYRIGEERVVAWFDTATKRRGLRRLPSDGESAHSDAIEPKYDYFFVIGDDAGRALWVLGYRDTEENLLQRSKKVRDLLRWSSRDGFELVREKFDRPPYPVPAKVFSFQQLSIDGTYWWRWLPDSEDGGSGQTEIMEIATGELVGLVPAKIYGIWLKEDRLCGAPEDASNPWTIWCWDSVTGAQQIRNTEITGSNPGSKGWLRAEASPDREQIMFQSSLYDMNHPREFWTFDPWLESYDGAENQWSTLEAEALRRPGATVRWVGRNKVLIHRSGYLGLLDIEDGATKHLIGRP